MAFADTPNPYESPRLEVVEQPPPADSWSPPRLALDDAIFMEGTVTFDDWRKAALLHLGARRWFPKSLITLLLLVLGVVLLAQGNGGYLAAGFVGLVLLAIWVVGPWQLRTAWKSSRIEPLRRYITEDGIQTDTPTVRTVMAWEALSKHRISQDMVLLYTAPAILYYWYPRRFFQREEDWNAFLVLVQRKLPRG
jgi:hypothetical protein